MKKYIVIVAGGKGLRMGTDIPKQFLPIGGKPALMRTIETFYTYDTGINIIVVLPVDQQKYWCELCHNYHFDIPHRVTDGGNTRFHSVKNGLAMVDNDSLVGIHDGVRPFVSHEVITMCYQEAALHKAVIPVVDVVETLRQLHGNTSVTVDRSAYKLVQTPQVFSAKLLKDAYQQPYSTTFTDDASVVEALGMPVTLVPGNRENIKLTTPFDIKVAEALIGCSI